MIPMVGIILLLCFSHAMGQAGTKESQKFLAYSEDARKALVNTRAELDETVALYNNQMSGEAEKPETT